jgi:hypothetical protein
MRYATSRKVAGSTPDEVNEYLIYLILPAALEYLRIVFSAHALSMTQPSEWLRVGRTVTDWYSPPLYLSSIGSGTRQPPALFIPGN